MLKGVDMPLRESSVNWGLNSVTSIFFAWDPLDVLNIKYLANLRNIFLRIFKAKLLDCLNFMF